MSMKEMIMNNDSASCVCPVMQCVFEISDEKFNDVGNRMKMQSLLQLVTFSSLSSFNLKKTSVQILKSNLLTF